MALDYSAARAAALAAILPPGEDRWVALYNGDPTDTGVELELAGYARVAHSSWLTTVGVGSSARANVGAITFDAVTEDGAATHWAIFDDDVAGNLLHSNVLLDGLDEQVAIALVAGDNLEFADGELVIQLVGA